MENISENMARFLLFIFACIFFFIAYLIPNTKECHTIKNKGTETVSFSLDNGQNVSVDKETYEKHKVGDNYCVIEKYNGYFITFIVLGVLFTIIFFLSIGCIEILEVLAAFV